jgi:hypothetical protein
MNAKWLRSLSLACMLSPAPYVAHAQNLDGTTVVTSRAASLSQANRNPRLAIGNWGVLSEASRAISAPLAAVIETDVAFSQLSTSEAEAQVGRGYDVWNGRTTKVACVEPRTAADRLPFEPKVESGVIYTRSRELREHSSVGGGGVSLGLMLKNVGIGFSHSSTSGNFFNSVDEYVRTGKFVELKGIELVRVKWTAEARDLLAQNRIYEFVQKCGTRYISLVRAGQSIDTTARAKMTVQGTGAADANAMKITFGQVLSLGATSSSAETRLNTNTEISYVGFGRGTRVDAPVPFPALPAPAGAAASAAASAASDVGAGTGVSVPNGQLTSLLTYVKSPSGFAKDVGEDGLAQAVPLWLRAERYAASPLGDLPNVGRIPKWLDDLEALLAEHYGVFQDLATVRSDLDYALEPGAIKRYDVYYAWSTADAKKEAEDRRAKTDDILKAFQTALAACQRTVADELSKMPQTSSAVSTCQALLKDKLTPKMVGDLRLVRKFE